MPDAYALGHRATRFLTRDTTFAYSTLSAGSAMCNTPIFIFTTESLVESLVEGPSR